MNINRAIKVFAEFLNVSWSITDPLISKRTYTSDESSRNDWIQANWEILVERKVLPLNEYLEVYGEGADFNGASSRITDIEANATYSIRVFIKNATDILSNERIQSNEYAFERLVGFKYSFYVDSPPFEYVLVQDEDIGIERVFPIKNVEFKIQLINTKSTG
jgi:hypothetical protein